MRQTSKVHWDFKKLAKIAFFTFVIPVVTGLLFVFFAPIMVEHFKKEQCLDSGGHYIEAKRKCERVD